MSTLRSLAVGAVGLFALGAGVATAAAVFAARGGSLLDWRDHEMALADLDACRSRTDDLSRQVGFLRYWRGRERLQALAVRSSAAACAAEARDLRLSSVSPIETGAVRAPVAKPRRVRKTRQALPRAPPSTACSPGFAQC